MEVIQSCSNSAAEREAHLHQWDTLYGRMCRSIETSPPRPKIVHNVKGYFRIKIEVAPKVRFLIARCEVRPPDQNPES